MQEITKEIRKFLWKGGKSNGSKKFHLVNWDIVCSPKNCEGAGIRDPTLMNLTLRAKILWRIVSGEKAWWKEILGKRYMKGTRKICFDEFPLTGNGSPIWNLCEKAVHIIKKNLLWISINGKQIRIWSDNLGPISPTNHLVSFAELKQWLDHLNISTLFYLSSWNNSGIWVGWKELEIPKHLIFDFTSLLSLLQGSVPIHCHLSDGRGWGKSGIYPVKEGY